MTAPIHTQAEAMLARLAPLDPRQPANVHQVCEVLGMVRDLARVGVVRAAVLEKHSGPFFTGHESHCGCGQLVGSRQEWAVHVMQAMAGAS